MHNSRRGTRFFWIRSRVILPGTAEPAAKIRTFNTSTRTSVRMFNTMTRTTVQILNIDVRTNIRIFNTITRTTMRIFDIGVCTTMRIPKCIARTTMRILNSHPPRAPFAGFLISTCHLVFRPFFKGGEPFGLGFPLGGCMPAALIFGLVTLLSTIFDWILNSVLNITLSNSIPARDLKMVRISSSRISQARPARNV